VDELTSTTGIVALGAAVAAAIALLIAIVLAVRLRRLRAAQTAVLGAQGSQDLVTYVQTVGDGFTDLREWVEGALARVDERLADASERVDGCIAYRSLVRYDAFGELTGHQSTTIALLDAEHNGVVLSAIANRDSARLYCKQVIAGEGEFELSPEEAEAVRLALAGEVGSRTLD
jgi:hypothetical protein